MNSDNNNNDRIIVADNWNNRITLVVDYRYLIRMGYVSI